ncbi:17108_t:CDS:2, partial [Cetraspora pellucida]
QADKISIPNLEHINNIYNKYFLKRSNDASPHFYLQAIDGNPEDKHVGKKRLGTYFCYIVIASEIDISNHRITNQSGCFQQYKRPKNNIQINKLEDLSRMIMLDANYNNSQDQVNPLLTKKAILTTSTATTMQATSAIPTFHTAKKILQDSQLNNIESVTLSTESSYESFKKFNKLFQGTIYNNSNVTYYIHHYHYYNTSPSQYI